MESRNEPVVAVELSETSRPPVPAVATLPNESSNCTVNRAEAVSVATDEGAEVNTSLAAAAAATVSFCVAEVRPVAAAVRVGVPAAVSL